MIKFLYNGRQLPFGLISSMLFFGLVITPQFLFGQYAGGIGRGDTLSVRDTFSLEGPAFSPSYAGGSGRGDTLASLIGYYLDGPCANPPALSCPSSFAVCNTAEPITLSGATPVGGTYTGTKVVNGVFDPTASGVGVFAITYSYTDTAGCTNSCSFNISVIGTPTINSPGDSVFCKKYFLPYLIGGGNYFTEPNGGGTLLMAGDSIEGSQQVFIFAESATTPNCIAQDSFDLTLDNQPPAGTCPDSADVFLLWEGGSLLAASLSTNFSDNCDGSAIELAFSSDFLVDSLHFSCNDAAQGSQSIQLFIRDSSGNQRMCNLTRFFNQGSECFCLESPVNLSGNLNQGVYAGQTTLQSQGVVEADSTVGFRAGATITLNPGFHAKYGSAFSAQIDDCIPGNQQGPPLDQPGDLFNLRSQDDAISRSGVEAFSPHSTAQQLSLHTYPNPFREGLNLAFQLPAPSPVTIRLQSIDGRIGHLLIQDKNMAAGNHQLRLQEGSLPTGVFIITLQTNTGMAVQKIIKVE